MKSNHYSYVPQQLKQVARDVCIQTLRGAGALLVAASLTAAAQDFSDNFTRSTNSTSVLPWQVQAGNWVITNGAFFGGPNGNDSYGFAYITNSLTNCTVTGEFSAPNNAFGYGLGARVDPASGAHYAAWLYPDNSPFGNANTLKLIKFPDWGASSFAILQSVNVGSVGSGPHTITMALDTNLINVYLDGVLQITLTDTSSPLLSGGISVDMYTFSSDTYALKVDNISGYQINYPPISTRDSFTLRGDSTQTVSAPGVLYNDTDPDSTNLTAFLVSTTLNGTLNLGSNGSFTYTRTNNSAFYDSFTYRATDGTATSGVATVLLSLTSGGAFFSDNFSRATNPASLLPWTAQQGNWAITNGALEGGTNVFPSYGSVYREANWTNYAVEGSFLYPSNAYGGGIAGRVDPVTGQRYVAWFYPELSDRGPNHIRVAKFQTWTTYGLFGAGNAQALVTIALDSVVGTNTWHTLKLAFQTNVLAVYFDGQWLTNVGDFDTYSSPYLSGGMGVDFFSFTNEYILHADDVSARPLVADDGYAVAEDTQLIVGGSGVLTNDTSMTNLSLTAMLVGSPAHGNLEFSTNGSFTYTPVSDFYGTDSFTYEARAGTESLGAAVVVITVTPANDPPILADLPDRTIAALSTLSVTNTATDPDVPANNLTYALVEAPGGMTISTNGVITWTPTLAHAPGSNVITTVVTDNGLPPLSATNSFTVVITNPPGAYHLGVFFEDFDSVTIPGLPSGWTTSASGAQSTWITQNTNRATLPNAAFSPDPASSGINELVSPAIALPVGNLQLSFRNNYDLEAGFDGGVLEIKIGAGAFTNILAVGGDFVSGGYTHTLAVGFTNALEGRRVWSGSSGGFVTTVVALPVSASGQTIRLRWRCGADVETGGGGWWIDSIAIQNNLCCNLFAPVLPAQPNRTVSELVTMTVTNTATDGDLPDDKLTYSLTVAPSGATITTNGVIAWLPTESQGPSVNTFTTVVTDKAGLANTNSFTVTVNEVNVAPAFALTPTNRTIAELTLLTVTNVATDTDLPAQSLTYTLTVTNLANNSVVTNAGITNGVISWTPTEAQGPGTNRFQTVVSDGQASRTNVFDVAVTEVNVAPVFVATPPNVTIVELVPLTVTNNATDTDLPANTLSYQLIGAPTGASINTNGVITWTPSATQGSTTNTITSVVSDGTVGVTNNFLVTVLEGNMAPVFAGTPTNRTIAELTLLTVTNHATDSDLPANTLTYQLIGAPGGAVIDTNGVITWTPDEGQGPTTNTIITVVDDGTESVTNSFVVTVTEVNVAPAFVATPPDVTIAELAWLTVTNNATDSDLPANVLDYQLLNPPAGAHITANGVIHWAPDVTQGPGAYTFTTVVSDGLAGVTNNFVVTVNDTLFGVATNLTLVSTGAVWRYLDDGSDQSTAWRGAGFNDAGWSNGPAQLGYGDGDEQTVVSFGTNTSAKYITTYFRRTFAITDRSYFSALNLRVLRDDGVVVYLNGAEVYRNNLPAGAVTYQTLALAAIGGVDETTFLNAPLDLAGLVNGTNDVAVEIHQNSPTSSDLSFDLELTGVLNQIAPMLSVQTDRTIAELTTLTVTNTASDVDTPANQLTYSLVNAPGNAVISANGVITWTPGESEAPGTNTITSVVNDGSVSVTNAFTVVVTEVNVAPAFVATPANRTLNEQTVLTVTNAATDADLPANTLTYSLVNPPGNAAINSNGVITWTPSESEGPGTNTITSVVNDGSVSVTNAFTVVVTEVNVAPAFVATPANRTLNEQTVLTVTNAATDADLPANTLTYSLVNPPGNAVINSNGVITWTPSESEGPGTNTITSVVNDGNVSVTNAFTVVVSEVNLTPSFVATPANRTINEQTLLSVTNNATDSDLPANILTYSLLNPPAGAAISTNGVITWTPTEVQGPTTNTLTSVVNDGSVSVTNAFTVVVSEVNVAPAFVATPANRTLNEQTLLTVTNNATDADLPANTLTYSLVNPPGNAAINSNGVITWTPSESEGPGTNTITSVVNDGSVSVTNAFTVVVTEVNVAPAFVATPANRTLNEQTVLTVTNAATDADLPANTLTYSLVNAPGNAAINSNGVITWTPSESEGPGTNTITSVVNDGSVSVTNAFTVVVTEVNVAPAFVATPANRTLNEQTVLTVTNNATDADLPANTLTYSLVNAPGNAAINSNGVITWTPSESEGPGTNTITSVVNDGSVSVTNAFTVVVTEVNVAPAFVATPANRTLNEQTVLTVTNNATDADLPANTLTYSLVNPPGNAVISANGVITWTPGESEAPGTNTITSVVNDGSVSVTNAFTVVVTEVNVAPAFVATPANRTLNEQTVLTVTNAATDADLPANSLSYSLVNAPGNAAINSNGVITWTPSESEGPGTNTITSVVNDGSVSVTNAFTVVVTEVNVAPAFVATPANRTLNEQTVLTVTNSATDADLPANTLTYSLVNPPGNAVINSNGVITWTPSESEGPGTNTLTSVVNDGSVSVTNAFTVVVTEVNVAPAFVATPANRTLNEQTVLTVTNNATDADLPANTLTYSLVNPPGNAAINSNGVITWTPSESEGPGTNTITSVVNDGSVSVTNAFTVVVTEVNVAPAFVATPANRTLNEQTVLTVTNAATDADLPANTLTYSLVNPPGNAAINSNGVITWTPSESEGPGTNTITSVVNDGSVSVTNAFTVVVTEVNVAPAFVATPANRTLNEQTVLTVTNSATDADLPANSLSYSLVNAPGNAAINSNGVITWTPSESEGPGTNTITSVVNDGSVSVTNAFTVVVTEVNVAPAFVATPANRTLNEQTVLTVTNNATDADLPANTLTYSLVNPPGNAAINSNGVITWTPSESEGPGTNTITSVVNDGSVSVTNAFTVVVTEVNVAPAFVATPANRTLNEQTVLTVTNNATDADLPANTLTYSLVNAPGNAAINSNGVITWTPSESEGPGTNTITSVVNDGNVSVTNAFTVVVSEVNLTPSFVATPANRTINEQTLLSVTNNATDSDLPANILTYSLLNPPAGAAISTNGVITWTPTEVQGPTTNTLTSVVNDGSVSVTNAFTVVVSEVNVAPAFVATPANRTLNEQTLLTVTNNATDADLPANSLSYTLVNAPAGAAISTNGVITWTPTEVQGPTTNTLTSVVNDGSVSVTNAFTVVVSEVNVAPAFVATPANRTLNEQTLLTVTNNATDSDLPANILTYSLLNPPAGAAISTNGVITWTPGEAQGPTTNVLTSVVNDGSVSVTNAFTIVVTEVNLAPSFVATPANRTLNEQTLLTVTNNATDSDLPANLLTYSLVNPPAGATISTAGVITWTPTEAQGPATNTITSVVNDGNVSVTNAFTVVVSEVNLTPSFVATPANRTINEQTLLSVTNNATDSDLPANILTYSLLNPPAGAAISTNGVITWTPTEVQGPTTNTLTSVVNDGSVSVTNAFTVVVSEVNVAPAFVATPANRTLNEQTLLTVTNNATDSDLPANILTYSLLNPPAGAAISTNGVITWTPGEAQGPTTNVLTSVVNDGSVSVTNAFTIVVTEVNLAPSFVATPANRTLNEQTLLTVTNNATDSDLPANLLTYSLVNPPAGATISTAGVITWTPTEAQGPATNTITSVVNDGTVSVTNAFTVVVSEVNLTPSFVATPANRTINEQTLLSVTNNATDSDLPANILTYSLLNPPAGAAISTNGVITWTPTEVQGPTTNTLTSVVNDGSVSVTNAFTVVVSEVNVAPAFVATPANRTLNEQTLLTVTNNATDSDLPANILTYSLLNPPAGAAISTNGVITWTPGEAQGPTTNVLTSVVNDGSVSVTNAFTIVVTEVNLAPSFVATPANRTLNEQTLLTVTNNATDSDLPANLLTYSLVNPPAGATISTAGVITWTPTEAQGPATNTITSVVNDGTVSVTNAFTVTVTEVNVAPIAVNNSYTVSNATLTVSAPGILANDTDSDLPANSLTAVLVSGTTNGVLNLNSNGGFTYTANLGFNGVDAFTYRVNDGSSNSAPATVTLTVLEQGFRITSVTASNGVATVTWISQIGKAYRLLYKDDLASANWSVAIGDITAAATLTSKTNSTGSVAQRFYRVQMLTNSAPTLSNQSNRTVAELATLTVTNSAADINLPNELLNYSLLAGPSGAVISASGVITWTPTEAQGPSTNAFTTKVTDNGGLSTTNTFTVVVIEVNVAPAFVVLPSNRTINEQTLLTVTNNATDSDLPTNTLSYSLVNPPVGAAISTSGVITWTPTEAQGPTTNTLTSVVNDGTVSVTNSFTVVVNEVNVPPSFAGTPANRTINEQTLLTVTNNAADSDLPINTLNYSLIVAPTNAAISSAGVITWTPTEAQGPSTNTFTTVVNDGLVGVTNSFTVVVTEVNLSPVASNDSYNVTNSTLTVAAPGVLANDTDSDLPANLLRAVLVSGPTNGVLNLSTNGGFTYTPNGGFSGVDRFTYRANDGLANSGVATVTLTVSNQLFVITSVTVSNGLAKITWNSQTGTTYRVQYKDNLTSTTWTDLAPDVTATNFSASTTNFVGSVPQRFYRVMLAPVSPPTILSLTVTNGVANVTWSAVATKTYRLQYKTNLTDLSWTEVATDVTASGPIASTTNSVGANPRRFFRVRMLP